MGEIHQLIEQNGRELAKAISSHKMVNIAAEIMGDEDMRIGIMHAGFAMTALPHRKIAETLWVRQAANVKMQVESGRDVNDQMVGIPYGSVARMILLYLQTEAVKTRSREIELGRSMNNWLSGMGIDNGGKSYRMVREQSKRISLCRLTFHHMTENATMVSNGSFVRDAIIPSKDCEQLSLWRETVTLDEGFYESLTKHPLPVREMAIRQLSGQSMAIDIYIWLAYRLHCLENAVHLTWPAIYGQFGAGYQHIRQFKARFNAPLNMALAAYPEAKIRLEDTGMWLSPSPPPVTRSAGGVTRVTDGGGVRYAGHQSTRW